MTDSKTAPTNLQIVTADVTENTHVSAPESTPTLYADDVAPLKKIHNKHAGKGKYLRGKAATDVQQAYQRALSVAPDAVREYLDSRDLDVDDGASDISDASMEVADDDSAPPSPGTGCGSCREALHGTDYKARLSGSLEPAAPNMVAPAVDQIDPATVPVETLFRQLESDTGHPLYRRITYRVVNGQKVPTGEKNTDSPAQIAERRGSGPVLSLAVKHVPQLYVVDVDTKAPCLLKDYLDSQGVGWTETNKGFHYYVRISGMVQYKQQQKVCADESIAVDLLRQNNVWENQDRVFHGTADLVELPWSDLAQYFNVPRMTGKKPPAEKSTAPTAVPPEEKTTESTHAVDESALSVEMNRLLAEEPYSIDKKLTWFVLDINNARARICNRENVCVARLCDKDGGEWLEHRDKNERQSLLMVCRKNKVEATCLGKCKKQTLTKTPGFGDCAALRTILWPGGDDTPESQTDSDVGQIKGLQLQQMLINDIALDFIKENGFEKDAGFVVMPDPRCPYNRVPMVCDDGSGEKQLMDIPMLVSLLENEDPRVGKLCKASPSFRASTVKYLPDNLTQFPTVCRSKLVYGYKDGFLEIGEYLPEDDTFMQTGEQKARPLLRFTPYADLTDDHPLAKTVARVFINTAFNHEWLTMTETDLLERHCKVLKSVLDPSFHPDKTGMTEMWEINGKCEQWYIRDIIVALLGRTLFKLKLCDEWRVMLWMWGESSCGKTTLIDLPLKSLLPKDTTGVIMDNFEETFGLGNLYHLQAVSFPDIKPGCPLKEATFQVMVEGGQTSIAIKNGLAKMPLWDKPLLAGSQHPPTPDIWTDPKQAVTKRTFCAHFDTIPETTNELLGSQMCAAGHLGPTLVLFIRQYCRLKAFVGNRGFTEWAKTLHYIREQHETQRLSNNHLLRFLAQTKGDNSSKEKIWWFEYEEGAQTTIAQLKKSYGAWMDYTEGKKKPDLQGPFTKQNMQGTLNAASDYLGGKLEYYTPSRPNVKQCFYCKQEEPERTTGVCCDSYKQEPKTKWGKKSAKGLTEQACIKNLVMREEDRSGIGGFFANQAGSMCPS